jgi:polysaccharide export outer membrane protein
MVLWCLGTYGLVLPAMLQAQEYELGPGDVVYVEVDGQAAMTGELSIGSDGMLQFPILGPVKASAMTPHELTRKLTTLLADGYVKRPQVTIAVRELQSQRVYVTGEVAQPGAYPLPPDRTLLTLLRAVGNLSPTMGHEVVVIRPPMEPAEYSQGNTLGPPEDESEGLTAPDGDDGGDGQGESEAPAVPQLGWQPLPNAVPGSAIFRIKLTELVSGNPERNISLLPRDTIFFAPAAKVYITGHVVRPGPHPYQEGLTVFHALTLAGGLTPRGSKKVKIIRLVDSEQIEVKVKMTDLVMPEDTIMVPERFF